MQRLLELRVAFTVACFASTTAAQATAHAQRAITSSAAPQARAHSSAVYDAVTKRVLLVGGSTSVDGGKTYSTFDDVWNFDGHTWHSTSARGTERSGMALAFDSKRKRIVAFGGYCPCIKENGGRSADLLEWKGGQWRVIGAIPERPTTDASMIYDIRRDKLVLFGGIGATNQRLNDTWEYDGSSWRRVDGPMPQPTTGIAMSYDEKRGRTVLFGGFGPDPRAPVPETWEYDGSAWSIIRTVSPELGINLSATYDSKRAQVVLYVYGNKNDTWSWNGMSWTKLANSGPSKRYLSTMAYDASRDRVVLFGGRTGFPQPDRGDTWEFYGMNWTQVASEPPAFPQWGSLRPGPYGVGFKTERVQDATRAERSIRISMWYPATKTVGAEPMRFRDFVLLRETERTAKQLTREQETEALNGFAAFIRPMWGYPGDSSRRRLFPDNLPPSRATAMMSTMTSAIQNATMSQGRFPVVLFIGPSEVHSVMFEYLASQGFVVAAIPDLGDVAVADQPAPANGAERARIKTDDLAFLLSQVKQLSYVDTMRVAALGTAGGLLPTIRLQARDASFKALILQGSALPPDLTPENIAKLRAPMFMLVPGDVGVMDANAPQVFRNALATLSFADRRILWFRKDGHPEFSVYRRAVTPERAATEHATYDVMSSYVLYFLKAALFGDGASRAYMQNSPEANGISADLYTMEAMAPATAGPGARLDHAMTARPSPGAYVGGRRTDPW